MKSNGNFRKLLKERINKTNPRRTLTADEQRRLSKLEAVAEKLMVELLKLLSVA